MQGNINEMPADPSTGAQDVAQGAIQGAAQGASPLMASPTAPPGEAPMGDLSMSGDQQSATLEAKAEMKFELERMLEKISKRDIELKEEQALNFEKLEEAKAKIIEDMFELMKDLGVDPSDLESINKFLQQLQYQNPDLYIMFETAMNSLSPGEALAESEAGPILAMPEAGPVPGVPEAGSVPGAPEAGPVPGAPEAGLVSGAPGPAPGLMENNTTNLQEGMLRR